MFDEKQINLIKRLIDEAIRKMPRQKLLQSDVPPQTIKYRHIEDKVIVFGLAADRPTDGSDVGVYAYFATDTNVLSCWNGTAWVSETLT